MTREELELELDTVVMETATLSKKDRDRLVDALMDYVLSELMVEIDENEEDVDED